MYLLPQPTPLPILNRTTELKYSAIVPIDLIEEEIDESMSTLEQWLSEVSI